MATAAHPLPDELVAFAQGRLSADESATIEEHLQSCDTCASSLERQPEDSLLRVARQAGAVTEGGTLPPQATTAEAPTETGEALPSLPPELSGQGRYRIVRMIGQGGMGAVYEAQHGVMQRAVAFKVIKRAYIADAPAVERFRREARAAARLHHPNIVTAFDAESCGDTHFLVMEYVPGKTLAHVLKDRGPLPVAEASDYIRQTALGLQHAHEMGMVHRDVKPDNLMLAASPAASAPGLVKVLDFGLASLAMERDGSGLTEVNVIMGTPAYMAPEQATDAHTADIRADIYSLGCTLFHLLTGEVPYSAPTSLLKIIAHREQPVPQVRRKRPEVPEGLAAVLARMLAKKPDERYQTPGEVAAALAPFAADVPAPPKKPRRLVVAALLLALIALAGAVVYRIQTDKGELVITTESDDVEVIVKQGGKLVDIIDTKTDKQISLALRSGVYELELKGAPEGLKLTIDKATLTRGKQTLAKIERIQPASLTNSRQAATGMRVLQRVPLLGNPTCYQVAISPDGKLFASDLDYGKGVTVVIWDGQTGKDLQHIAGWTPAFTPDGKRLIVMEGSNGLVSYDVSTWKKLKAYPGGPLGGYRPLPDGKHLLVWRGTAGQASIYLVDLDTGDDLQSWNVRDLPYVVAPEGSVLLVKPLGEQRYRAWDYHKNVPSEKFSAITRYDSVRAILPGNKLAVVKDGAEDNIIVEVANGRRVTSLPKLPYQLSTGSRAHLDFTFPGSTLGINDSVNGNRAEFDYRIALHAGQDGTLRLFDGTGKEQATFQLPDGERLRYGSIILLSPDAHHACVATSAAVYLLQLSEVPSAKDKP